jgi:hypothetical protein
MKDGSGRIPTAGTLTQGIERVMCFSLRLQPTYADDRNYQRISTMTADQTANPGGFLYLSLREDENLPAGVTPQYRISQSGMMVIQAESGCGHSILPIVSRIRFPILAERR